MAHFRWAQYCDTWAGLFLLNWNFILSLGKWVTDKTNNLLIFKISFCLIFRFQLRWPHPKPPPHCKNIISSKSLDVEHLCFKSCWWKDKSKSKLSFSFNAKNIIWYFDNNQKTSVIYSQDKTSQVPFIKIYCYFHQISRVQILNKLN